jgi:ketosteroid isomerase-like protein
MAGRRPEGGLMVDTTNNKLVERLARLEDEAAIRETMYVYGDAIDYGHEQEFLDCWTEDAVLVWAPTPERDVDFIARRLVGRAAIKEAFRAHTHAPVMFHKHLLFQPQIRLDGDRATVHSGFARLDEGSSGPTVRSFGRYSDTMVRCEDGRWRFSLRDASVESSVASTR